MAWVIGADGTYCDVCGYKLPHKEDLLIKDLYEKVKCPNCETTGCVRHTHTVIGADMKEVAEVLNNL